MQCRATLERCIDHQTDGVAGATWCRNMAHCLFFLMFYTDKIYQALEKLACLRLVCVCTVGINSQRFLARDCTYNCTWYCRTCCTKYIIPGGLVSIDENRVSCEQGKYLKCGNTCSIREDGKKSSDCTSCKPPICKRALACVMTDEKTV